MRKRKEGDAFHQNTRGIKKKVRFNPKVTTIRQMKTLTGETKYFDSGLIKTNIAGNGLSSWLGTNVDPAGLGSTMTLFAPALGTDIDNRIGRKVMVMSIKMNITISIAAQAAGSAADEACVIRLIMFQDKQSNGTQATGDQLMEGNPAGVFNDLQFQNRGNFGRFKVIWDKRFVLQDPNFAGTGTADTYDQQGLKKVLKLRKKFKQGELVHFFAGTATTAAQIVDNSWHLLATCDSNQLVPQISYVCRTSYKDA